MNKNEQMWSVEDVAKWANVGEFVVYRAVRTGKLRAARVDRRGTLRFSPEWVRQWFDSEAAATSATAATMGDLVAAAKATRSTIHRWIAVGLLPRPNIAQASGHRGRSGRWDSAVLERAKSIRERLDSGATLKAIQGIPASVAVDGIKARLVPYREERAVTLTPDAEFTDTGERV